MAPLACLCLWVLTPAPTPNPPSPQRRAGRLALTWHQAWSTGCWSHSSRLRICEEAAGRYRKSSRRLGCQRQLWRKGQNEPESQFRWKGETRDLWAGDEDSGRETARLRVQTGRPVSGRRWWFLPRNFPVCPLFLSEPCFLFDSSLWALSYHISLQEIVFGSGNHLAFGSVVKNPPANAGNTWDVNSIPESGISSGKGNGTLLWYFFAWEMPGQRSLVGYSLRGCKRIRHHLTTKQEVTTQQEKKAWLSLIRHPKDKFLGFVLGRVSGKLTPLGSDQIWTLPLTNSFVWVSVLPSIKWDYNSLTLALDLRFPLKRLKMFHNP